jgi:uncharacterized membrane protein YdbT with pleckstrin-like domain
MTDDLLLHADEELLWSGSPRLSAAADAAVAGALLLAVAVAGFLFLPADRPLAATVVLLALVALGLAIPLLRLLQLRRTTFAVSDTAVYARSGVLSRQVRRVGLERVQNSAYSQSLTGSLFGYGTVTLESAGGEAPVQFSRIETPREVRALVDRRVDRAADPIPGTVEQWEAVLAATRELRTAVERRGLG